MTTTVLFLPPAAGDRYRWLRIEGGAVTARGDGLPDRAQGEQTVAIAPADAVSLHWADLPDRSPAQALAAARLAVMDASAAPLPELHVAIGRENTADRPIGVVAAGQMRAWLDRLAAEGVDPDRMVPAALLLPRPDEGFVRADLGDQAIVRGPATAFADEAPLTDLVIGDAPQSTLDRAGIEAAIAAAVAAPALDLRQGAFARRRHGAIDWALVRRCAWLLVALLVMSLLVGLARLVRLEVAADRLEAQTEALARSGLPAGETVNDAGRQLTARLSGLRGPGQGFTRSAAAVFAVLQAVPGAELTGLSFQPDGTLRLSVAVPSEGAVLDVRNRLARAGFGTAAGTFTSANGRFTGDLTMTTP